MLAAVDHLEPVDAAQRRALARAAAPMMAIDLALGDVERHALEHSGSRRSSCRTWSSRTMGEAPGTCAAPPPAVPTLASM
jgi:hypothetical protein